MYKCNRCVEWSSKVDHVIMPALDSGKSNDILPEAEDGEQREFYMWDSWKRSIFPEQKKFPIKMTQLLLIARIWNLQAEQIV